MAAETLTKIPDTITAGSTVTYTSAQSDYTDALGWGLTLYLAGASVANVAASVVDGQFVITLSASATAALTPGLYQYSEIVSKGTAPNIEKHEVGRGGVIVLADIAAATAGSMQTWAEKELATVRAKLTEVRPTLIEAYTIGQRQVAKQKIRELEESETKLTNRVARERNKGRTSRPVYVTFGGGQ